MNQNCIFKLGLFGMCTHRRESMSKFQLPSCNSVGKARRFKGSKGRSLFRELNNGVYLWKFLGHSRFQYLVLFVCHNGSKFGLFYM